MALTLQSRWLRADDLEWVQTLIDTHFQDLFGQTLDGFCIGPNSAGKTTVLNLMGGLYTPDAGTILLGTENVTGLPPYRISRAGLLSRGEQQMLTLARGLLIVAMCSRQAR